MAIIIANASSATATLDASGVLTTVIPLDSAYGTSIVSTPTPPLMTNLSLGALSIIALSTLVLDRTMMISASPTRP